MGAKAPKTGSDTSTPASVIRAMSMLTTFARCATMHNDAHEARPAESPTLRVALHFQGDMLYQTYPGP